VSGATPDAVLPVDKPVGPTSHDVVDAVRRALGERRVGHTGTLDPFASGLLLVCVGTATRIAEYLTGYPKEYEATARLGIATDSEDRDGEIVSVSEGWRDLTGAAVEAAMTPFRGAILQVPPRFSAKKVGGVSAHRLARAGQAVALEPRSVTVYELTLEEFAPPDVRLRVRCSSGTYVRSLARDLGEALGVGAHLTRLRRTAVGPFRVESALSLEDLGDAHRVAASWIPPMEALAGMPKLEVGPEGERDLSHGRAIGAEGMAPGGPVVAVRDRELLAIGEVRESRFLPRKVLAHG